MADKKTAPALILTLGGAPDTPHAIPGYPGLYRPGRPTPIGGPGEITEDQARELDKAEGTPLKLVRVPADEIDGLREQQAEDIRASRQGQREARQAGLDGAEVDQVNTERAATA